MRRVEGEIGKGGRTARVLFALTFRSPRAAGENEVRRPPSKRSLGCTKYPTVLGGDGIDDLNSATDLFRQSGTTKTRPSLLLPMSCRFPALAIVPKYCAELKLRLLNRFVLWGCKGVGESLSEKPRSLLFAQCARQFAVNVLVGAALKAADPRGGTGGVGALREVPDATVMTREYRGRASCVCRCWTAP
jgi:hypothetical protein